MTKYLYNPIVITGPSGSGKSELIQYIENTNPLFEEASGITTRNRRENEKGKMNFITLEEFEEYINNRNLIEYTIFNGNYYGVSKDELKKLNDKQIIFNVGYSSAKEIKQIDIETLMIYLLPPNKEELLRRLGSRDYERYLLGMKETIANALYYEYLLISKTDDFPSIYNDFMNITQKNNASEKLLLRKKYNRQFIDNFYKE